METNNTKNTPFSDFSYKYILPIFAKIVISILSRSLRIYMLNKEAVQSIKKTGKNVIFAFWHGSQFLLVYTHRNKNVSIMTSLSKDGELQANILKKFNYNIIRGSSTRGGVRATLQMIQQIKQGRDVAFAVDGPHGPAQKVKPGVILLALKTNRVIIPVSSGSLKHWTFKKAWDKYILPKPFSSSMIMYGKPIEVKKGDNIDEKRIELENAINALEATLDKKMRTL